MQKHILLTYFLLTLVTANAVQQYIRFYSERDQEGSSVILEKSFADLEGFGSIINSNGSYEAVGWWDCFADKNFVNFKGTRFISTSGELQVQRRNLSPGEPGLSCRHWGSNKSEVQALTLYSEEDNAYCLGGSELLITGLAYSFLPFEPVGFVMIGWSNWTFFSGPNFDGTAICVISKSESHAACVNSTLAGNMKSVYKNCLGRIDTYLYF